jgi:hypothetical protein
MMTAPTNPFRPGFGESPTVWSRRGTILDAYRRAIDTDAGSPGRMLRINGARGIGKTTVVNELEDIARSSGWVLLRTSRNRTMLSEPIDTAIPKAINSLYGPNRRRRNPSPPPCRHSSVSSRSTWPSPVFGSQIHQPEPATLSHQLDVLHAMATVLNRTTDPEHPDRARIHDSPGGPLEVS